MYVGTIWLIIGMDQRVSPVVMPASAPCRLAFSHHIPRKNIGNRTEPASENAYPTSAAIEDAGLSAANVVSAPSATIERRPTKICWRCVASSLMMFV